MMIRILLCLLLFPALVWAQPTPEKKAYVEQYKYFAIENMHRTGVPASITLAQGLLESGVGKSPLATEANNHFGIKCHKEWTGPTFIMDDDEKNECFRKYDQVLDSYLDHAAFLKSRPRYNDLFKLDITDYAGWAHGLKAAGYATNPNYAPLLIKQIEELALSAFDRVTVAELEQMRNNKPGVPLPPNTTYAQTPAQPKTDDCKPGIFKYNGIKTICAKAGESPLAIAERAGVYPWQILKYNDIETDIRFAEGEKVYLAAKKKSAKVAEHVVGEFESLRDISQQYGISMVALRRKNQLREGEELAAGEIALLKNKRADRPKIRTSEELQALIAERDRRAAALQKPEAPVVVKKPAPPKIPVSQHKASSSMAVSTPVVPPAPKVDSPAVVTKKAETALPETLKPDLTPGTEVVFPDQPKEEVAKDAPEIETAAPPVAAPKKHTVVKGDTMFNISRRYGLSVDKLKQLNKLTGNDIKLGMELIVSE